MTHDTDVNLPEYTQFSLDQLAQGCQVSREWIIERVQSGLLWHDETSSADPASWSFDSRSFVRIRRISEVVAARQADLDRQKAEAAAGRIAPAEVQRSLLARIQAFLRLPNLLGD